MSGAATNQAFPSRLLKNPLRTEFGKGTSSLVPLGPLKLGALQRLRDALGSPKWFFQQLPSDSAENDVGAGVLARASPRDAQTPPPNHEQRNVNYALSFRAVRSRAARTGEESAACLLRNSKPAIQKNAQP
jgi:hypothetical protein